MREILFRGKRRDNDKWVYGDLRQFQILDVSSIYNYELNFGAYVTKETVGQYTGLTDKNGKKIFEGDIVRIRGYQHLPDFKDVDYNSLIAFVDGGFCALDGTEEKHSFRRYGLQRREFILEVVGNIHDNPELLGGADDEKADLC